MSDLNFTLHPGQMEVFKADDRFKIVVAGRRFGKSYLSAVTLLVEAMKTENESGYDLKNTVVYYVAPTFQQAKDIMWSLLKNLGQGLIASTYENTAVLKLINGREIRLKGSDRPDTLRGVGLSYVVLDEYATMKPETWEEILRPTLADVEGGALFIGTPAGKNHFFRLFQDSLKDDEWGTWEFKSKDNPFLPPKEIDKAKKTMSTMAYRQEFEASFSSGGGMFFKEEWFTFGPEPDEGYYYIAVDPAGYEDISKKMSSKQSRLDETAIAVVKVGRYGWWVKEIIHGRWGPREAALRIIKAAKSVSAMGVGIEGGSLKNAIDPYLEDTKKRLNVFFNIHELKHGGKKKEERIVWALQGRLEHGRITFNENEDWIDLMSQASDFPNPLAHDDLLDSLAYIDQIAQVAYVTDFVIDEWQPTDEESGY